MQTKPFKEGLYTKIYKVTSMAVPKILGFQIYYYSASLQGKFAYNSFGIIISCFVFIKLKFTFTATFQFT